MEVRGKLGMFARPDTGSEPSSYSVPPPSACQGMIESICRIRGTKVNVVAIGVCSPPTCLNYSFTSMSPIRKPSTIKIDAPCIIRSTVLENPAYQILAIIENDSRVPQPEKYKNINAAHSFQEQFFRRLIRGQKFETTSLGCRNFHASYVGLPVTPIIEYNEIIPSFLSQMWNDEGELEVDTIQNAQVKNGVLNLSKHELIVKDGVMRFVNVALDKTIRSFLKDNKND